ncbi:GTP cyclohydrolase II [Jannaschia sp. CCS1]|uniref:GTP cyclohydrolase II n=1 Tax=Jannaschia sp. (strain CCS1) TaxID=290400 RepID=UPI000053ABDA|nr:GTP cyclohydrolase II [Jannaschia sp. CCS1]ABD53333.1 GTP cyclohydrolase II [Jannaschia sp. CCS1]
MSLLPSISDLVARARSDLRVGLPVVLDRDGTGLIVLACETASDARLEALRALGPVTAAITGWRAETLKIRIYDGDIARITMPADAGARWLAELADPACDLSAPMRGPFREDRDGDASLHRIALDLTKSAQLLPAIAGVEVSAWPEGLTILPADLAAQDLAMSAPLSPVAAARLPMALAGAGRLHIFRPDNAGIEHYAIEVGRPDRSRPVLARLHSACFTGDVLGSLKCDCGPQLHAALAEMGRIGEGVLLYLNQEGRGIGLANKMRAYALQDQGFDTVEANHRLGFEDDERDFRIGADLLRRMGFDAVRLMTNNPRKVEMMDAEGIDVAERVPLIIDPNRHNADYLQVKRTKSGHLL